MASLFRLRRPAAEGGMGGKIPPSLALAHALQQSTPPPLPLLPPPPAQTGSPRWLLGLISGAGKLISSVFRSDGSSSSDYSSDGDLSSCPGEEDDSDAPKERHEVNQGGKKPELPGDCMEGSKAIVQPSESKLAIEQLLMQETFSREECNRLTKMIQSRVVGSSGAWQSLTPNLDLSESVPYSPVLETKKWLEEKKLASDAKHDLVCAPFPPKTDMLHYGIQDEVSSLVDLAKSYMQSLPARQSPSSNNTQLMTSQPSSMPLFKDESAHTTTNHSSPTLKIACFTSVSNYERKLDNNRSWHRTPSTPKVFKRKNLSRESQGDIRSVRQRSRDNVMESPKFEKYPSLAVLPGNDTSKISLTTNERDQEALGANQNSSSLQALEAFTGVVELSPELQGEDCSNEACKLLQIRQPITDNGSIIASEPEEAVKEIVLNHESSLQNTYSETTQYELKSELELSHGLDVNKIRKQYGIVDIHHEPLVSASMSMMDGVDPISEAKVMTLEDIESREHSDANDVTNLDDTVHTSTLQKIPQLVGIMEANIPMELNMYSGTKRHGGNPQLQEEANGSVNKFCFHGSSAEPNPNSDFKSFSNDNPPCTISIKEEPSTGIWEGTCEPPSESAIKIPAFHMLDSVPGKSHNSTRMRSVERMQIEPPPSTTRRRRKAKVRRRRGRGAK